jgi:hypothetical protein
VCICSCLKPKNLHMSCSHVMVVCVRDFPRYLCLRLLSKGINCIHMTVGGIRVPYDLGHSLSKHHMYSTIPDLRIKHVRRGRHKIRRIHNDMDQCETGQQIKSCSASNVHGHTYKHCTKNAVVTSRVTKSLITFISLLIKH